MCSRFVGVIMLAMNSFRFATAQGWYGIFPSAGSTMYVGTAVVGGFRSP